MMSDTNSSPATRLRKAWNVSVRGYDHTETYFAPTAGKARMMAFYRAEDVSVVHITVRRQKASDVHLPARDPMADEMSDAEIHCLLHAFGANGNDPTKAGYRDYFYTSRNDPVLCALAQRGLMTPNSQDKWEDGMTYFIMTDRGKQIAMSLVPEYCA